MFTVCVGTKIILVSCLPFERLTLLITCHVIRCTNIVIDSKARRKTSRHDQKRGVKETNECDGCGTNSEELEIESGYQSRSNNNRWTIMRITKWTPREGRSEGGGMSYPRSRELRRTEVWMLEKSFVLVEISEEFQFWNLDGSIAYCHRFMCGTFESAFMNWLNVSIFFLFFWPRSSNSLPIRVNISPFDVIALSFFNRQDSKLFTSESKRSRSTNISLLNASWTFVSIKSKNTVFVVNKLDKRDWSNVWLLFQLTTSFLRHELWNIVNQNRIDCLLRCFEIFVRCLFSNYEFIIVS